jgi:hypothetical protein
VELLSALELDEPIIDANLGDARGAPELDLLVGVERLRVNERAGALRLPAEVVLRERRALVRQLRLFPDQDEAAVESFFSQTLGGLGPGETGTDDYKCAVGGYGCPLSGSLQED